MELQHQLRLQFPQLQSHGMNHPPSDQNQLIAQVIGYIQMAGFLSWLLLFVKAPILKALQMEEPPMVKWMSDNKMNFFCLTFMMGFLSTQLMATGAFEVYYNGQVVYSKLEQGRIPHVQDLVRNLQMFGVQPQKAQY
jgi:selT/selW/selH-like putative selenoprotein